MSFSHTNSTFELYTRGITFILHFVCGGVFPRFLTASQENFEWTKIYVYHYIKPLNQRKYVECIWILVSINCVLVSWRRFVVANDDKHWYQTNIFVNIILSLLDKKLQLRTSDVAQYRPFLRLPNRQLSGERPRWPS